MLLTICFALTLANGAAPTRIQVLRNLGIYSDCGDWIDLGRQSEAGCGFLWLSECRWCVERKHFHMECERGGLGNPEFKGNTFISSYGRVYKSDFDNCFKDLGNLFLHSLRSTSGVCFDIPCQRACGNWQHTANAAIYGHNNVHLNDVTIEQCKDSCCANPQCKSFDYSKQSSDCDLSYSSASDVGGLKTNYPGNPYDHYALDRGSTDSSSSSSTGSPRTTIAPSPSPTSSPTISPTSEPTGHPSKSPSVSPTTSPTSTPSQTPSTSPVTSEPTAKPSIHPSLSPSNAPTPSPTSGPTTSPTSKPSQTPSSSPVTSEPTVDPTLTPTAKPSIPPSVSPTNLPTSSPTSGPTTSPTSTPSEAPTTNNPSKTPSMSPTHKGFEGSLCNADDECDSLRCNVGEFPYRCREKKPHSEECQKHSDCKSDKCLDGKCVDGRENDLCNSNDDCDSGRCAFGVPFGKCQHQVEHGSSCIRNNDCTSGHCLLFACTDHRDGAHCVNDDDCVQGSSCAWSANGGKCKKNNGCTFWNWMECSEQCTWFQKMTNTCY